MESSSLYPCVSKDSAKDALLFTILHSVESCKNIRKNIHKYP